MAEKQVPNTPVAEWVPVAEGVHLLQVPGGWIYSVNGFPCFVPDPEYVPTWKPKAYEEGFIGV